MSDIPESIEYVKADRVRAALKGHRHSELFGESGLLAATMRDLDVTIAERDMWKAKYIQQNKNLGCEMMDPNGTIWDYAKNLQKNLDLCQTLHKEYDVLLKNLNALAYWRDISECDCNNQLPNGGCLRCDLDKVFNSNNQNDRL